MPEDWQHYDWFLSYKTQDAAQQNGLMRHNLSSCAPVEAIMFTIGTTSTNDPRLKSASVLSADDFRAVAEATRQRIFSARKSALVSSRVATRVEKVETRWNGKETHNSANPFDHIVTSLDRSGEPLVDEEGHQNIYVIPADRFDALYQTVPRSPGGRAVYQARGTVEVVFLAGGFEIMAPWGEIQTADRGYLICNGPDVYGNNAETFEASYDRIA